MKADLDAAGRPLVDLAPAVKLPTFAQFTPEEQDFYLAFEKETQVGAVPYPNLTLSFAILAVRAQEASAD
jgi:hypothetical protein